MFLSGALDDTPKPAPTLAPNNEMPLFVIFKMNSANEGDKLIVSRPNGALQIVEKFKQINECDNVWTRQL